jgi:20S proteasome alpha/beta subunit
VTIGIGMICKGTASNLAGTIIFASDSQTTYPGAMKSLDAQKIRIINFADSDVLTAQAGMADLADAVVSKMQIKADGKALSRDLIESVALESVREIRNHLRDINSGCVNSDEGWKKFFLEDNFFELLVGYFDAQKPRLFTINISLCTVCPLSGKYRAIGSGREHGEYLLREYANADPDFERGSAIAACVIESAIQNANGCGSPMWIGGLWMAPESSGVVKRRKKTESRLMSKREIEWMTAEVKKSEASARSLRNEQLVKMLQNISEKRIEEALEEMAYAKATEDGEQIGPKAAS